jgi:uncharacterized membrane protein
LFGNYIFADFKISFPFLKLSGLLLHKNDVLNTWLESHFDWQIKTAWITLAGFAISGITFEFGVGLYVLISTIIYLVFRIVVGWNTLNDNKAIGEEN